METVDDQPDIGVVGAADDLPGVPVVPDMPPPGKRLVTDAQIAPRRALSELAQIIGRSVDTAQGGR